MSNVGFYGASGSGSFLAPGVEGESTNNGSTDAGGGFGLAFLAGKPAPYVGAIGYGSRARVIGLSTSPGTSSAYTASGFGVAGQDTYVTSASAASSGDYNAGVAGTSTYGTSVLAESNGTTSSSVNLFGTLPAGVYSVANTSNGTKTPGAVALLGESNYV